MKKYIFLFFTVIVFVNVHTSLGQNSRIHTSNTIGWYNYFGTFKVSQNFGVHTEYQWRRNQIITGLATKSFKSWCIL